MNTLGNGLYSTSYLGGISTRLSLGDNRTNPIGSGMVAQERVQNNVSVPKPATMYKFSLNVNPFLFLILPLLLAFLAGIPPLGSRSSRPISAGEVKKSEIRKAATSEKKTEQVSEVPGFLLY